MSGTNVSQLASMAEVLRYHAETTGQSRAFLYLEPDGTEGPELSYHQLDSRARAVASALSGHAGPGERAILLYSPGLEFIPAFFGCLYAGMIAVPAWPPRPDRPWQGTMALGRIARDCAPRVVLTGGEDAERYYKSCHHLPELENVAWINTSELGPTGQGWPPAAQCRQGISHLQYTSGSTGDPKGVIISNANVMENQRETALLCGHFETAAAGICGVNWLPFQHDFGLVGGLLQAVYVGGPLVVLSPLTMLQRPYIWLEAISRYHAHTTGGPNFAYQLCVRRMTPEQRRDLDLSHWKLAFIGAEPILPQTLDEFCEAFAPARFARESFCPAYGLAEATLFVTSNLKNHLPTTASLPVKNANDSSETATRRVIGCGRPYPGEDLQIINPDSLQPCPDGEIGEIWVAGPTLAQGYWNQPERSREVFHATLAKAPGKHYLRTGDLGRMSSGELFVTGRIKDLIIVRGQNHHPEDIEQSVASLDPALKPGTTAVFQVACEDGETLVILQEISRRHRSFDPDEFARRIRTIIIERHGLAVDDIIFVKQSTLPKTTTGKLQRFACRESYENDRIVRWTPKPSANQ